MKLVVGLGNPGPRYLRTRHNVGFRIADCFAGGHAIGFGEERFSGVFGSGRVAEIEVALLKPLTFMNRSGSSVGAAVAALLVGDPSDDLIVVYDDLDLPFGRVRVRPEGGAGGHRGMEDVIERLATAGFARLRFGIGRPPEGEDPVAYVLTPFSSVEEDALVARIEDAARAVACVIQDGVVAAMNRFNAPPERD